MLTRKCVLFETFRQLHILPTTTVGADIIRPYDENGNPVKMGDCEVIWTNGRQLSKIVYREDGTEMLSYTYDDNGIRTSKTYEGRTTYYTTIDGLITSEYTIDTNGSKINEIDYIYNSADEVIAATYKGKTYYYLKSATGDVVGAADETGRMIGLYQYDAWGNETERFFNTTDADEEHFLSINPMKYRGYYLDYEMEMYYLQSRYYFAHWCRFFNSDLPEYAQIQKDEQIGTNLFAYCCNDPVNNSDPTGNKAHLTSFDLLKAFLKNYLLKNKLKKSKITKYSVLTKDSLGINTVIVYYKNPKNKSKKFTITYGYKSSWERSKNWLNNIGLNEKLITNYSNIIKGVMTSAPPMTSEDAEHNKVKIISANIANICIVAKSGIRAAKISSVYKKVWGKNGIDKKNSHGYLLFRITNKKGLNGWYIFEYSTSKGKKI